MLVDLGCCSGARVVTGGGDDGLYGVGGHRCAVETGEGGRPPRCLGAKAWIAQALLCRCTDLVDVSVPGERTPGSQLIDEPGDRDLIGAFGGDADHRKAMQECSHRGAVTTVTNE